MGGRRRLNRYWVLLDGLYRAGRPVTAGELRMYMRAGSSILAADRDVGLAALLRAGVVRRHLGAVGVAHDCYSLIGPPRKGVAP